MGHAKMIRGQVRIAVTDIKIYCTFTDTCYSSSQSGEQMTVNGHHILGLSCLSKLVPLSSHWLPVCLQMKIPAHRDTRLPTVTSLATAKLPPEQMPATAQQPDSIRLLLHATTASPASLHMVPIGFHPTSPPSTSGLDIETRVSASVDESRAHKLQYSGCPFPNYSPTSRTPLQDTCPRFTTWANTHTSNNLVTWDLFLPCGPSSTTSRI